MQDSFYTIAIFTYPSEMTGAKIQLELSGIECFVRDENTAYASPLQSNAIGGIKLQVRQSDYEKAAFILKESGYHPLEETGPSRLYLSLDRDTKNIPVIGKWRLEYRIGFFVVIFLSLVLTALHFALS